MIAVVGDDVDSRSNTEMDDLRGYSVTDMKDIGFSDQSAAIYVCFGSKRTHLASKFKTGRPSLLAMKSRTLLLARAPC